MNEEQSIIKALKCSHEELQTLFKAAVREAVILEEENKRLKRVIRNIRMQVNCDN